MVEKHLDNIYRRHYEIFHMLWGKTHDSRVINWREIEWEKVIQIDVCIRGKKHTFSISDKPYTVGFFNFRWGGVNKIFDGNNKKWVGIPINYWTVGHILPGDRCVLTDIDFHSGDVLKKDYEKKTSDHKQHLHPRLIRILREMKGRIIKI